MVRTSILGATREVHDAISRAPGSFDQMLKGVRNLVDEGYEVRFNMVLTRENVHQAADTARVGIEHGAKSMKISGLVDLERNAGSFVPYEETANAVEAFCSVCEQRHVPYEIEKLPLCVAPRRMHHFVFEQGIFPTDRGVMTGPGQPAATVWCATSATVWSRPSSPPLAPPACGPCGPCPRRFGRPWRRSSNGEPIRPSYRVAFTRVADRDLPFQAWAELLRFKQRCEGEVGDLCVERGAAS